MLENIVILLPKIDPKFISLLLSCGNAKRIDPNTINFGKKTLKPSTIIKFNTDELSILFNSNTSKKKLSFQTNSHKASFKHNMDISMFYSKFKGKLTELNHTGISFPSKYLSKTDYLSLKSYLSKNSYLCKYPEDEEWPFIFPCTQHEFNNDISDFSINRRPQFELVYPNDKIIPVLQFDFSSKLSKQDVCKILPKPFGISYPGLENIFRSTYISTGFPGILIRFDINFHLNNNNNFCKWMITKGGRINIK